MMPLELLTTGERGEILEIRHCGGSCDGSVTGQAGLELLQVSAHQRQIVNTGSHIIL